MIERIDIGNFKSLKQVSLKLGRFNLFIGTNASGKSNFFDALRVLQGIGNGFTLQEILDGKPRSATSEVWDAIRGGSAKAAFAGSDGNEDLSFGVTGRCANGDTGSWKYEIAFSAREARLAKEAFKSIDESYISEPPSLPGSMQARYAGSTRKASRFLVLERHVPGLTQVSRNTDGGNPPTLVPETLRIAHVLADMQRLDPQPALLRGYSQVQEIRRLGERGENFAALVRSICADPEAKAAYLGWLRELRPHEVDDVGVLKGALGEPLFMLKEGGREFPAPVLSDGTLRFAAIAAASFQPDMPGILTIEEIENGIHASRLRLLVELLRNRAAQGRTQIMATTHSPSVLAWLKEEEYATTFFCKRDEETGESHIRPLSEIPHFLEIVRKQPISELFAEGWLEAAL